MRQLLQFAMQHGYPLLFGFVFAEQIGLPVPAVPFLLAMGTLTGRGYFGFGWALAIAGVAATACDLLWFALGRYRGNAVIRLVCRLSLEPDSCVRRTSRTFDRLGPRTLLFSKLLPGFSTVAPPLAGASGVSVWRFAAWDALGSLLWAGGYLGLGAIFSSEIERVAEWSIRLGAWFVLAALLGLAAYIGVKYAQRQRLIRSLHVARISPEELKAKLDSGEEVAIVDLRQPYEFLVMPETLPGAIRALPAALDALPEKLPPDRDVVLYCS